MSPLQQLQDDALNMLLGNPATSVVAFTSLRKQVIQSQADEAAAAWKVRATGKVGVACQVLMPSARVPDPNMPGPQFALELIVRTYEDPKVNNTGLTAEDVAIANVSWLDGMFIADLTELYCGKNAEAVRPNYDYPGMLVYDSILEGTLPQDWAGRTAAPAIAEVAGLVTLSCQDGAAVIYYTTDGSFPTPGAPVDGNQSTTIYTQPVQVLTGTAVRCLAWNPAKLPSHVDKATINF